MVLLSVISFPVLLGSLRSPYCLREQGGPQEIVTSIQDDTLLSEMITLSGMTRAEGDFILRGFFFFFVPRIQEDRRFGPCLVAVPSDLMGEKI